MLGSRHRCDCWHPQRWRQGGQWGGGGVWRLTTKKDSQTKSDPKAVIRDCMSLLYLKREGTFPKCNLAMKDRLSFLPKHVGCLRKKPVFLLTCCKMCCFSRWWTQPQRAHTHARTLGCPWGHTFLRSQWKQTCHCMNCLHSRSDLADQGSESVCSSFGFRCHTITLSHVGTHAQSN